MTVKELINAIEAKQSALDRLKQQFFQIWCDETGLKPNDVVTGAGYWSGAVYTGIIEEVQPYWDQITVKRIKKNGLIGTSRVNLNYDSIKLIQDSPQP